MLKRIILLIVSIICIQYILFSQDTTVTISAGTYIPITNLNEVRASKVKQGEPVEFIVSQSVRIDNIEVIPYNSIVRGVVREAKKSKIFGRGGKLKIQIENLQLQNGQTIPIANKTLNFDGDNRSWVPWAGCIGGVFLVGTGLGLLFIPGERAEIPAGYSTSVTVSSDTDIKVKVKK
ncbi:MAG: hypothetical protein J6P44_08680 [Bacteroidales bacterium]|nr:hypothetical protein [Bacteroidales bacterium]